MESSFPERVEVFIPCDWDIVTTQCGSSVILLTSVVTVNVAAFSEYEGRQFHLHTGFMSRWFCA